MKKGRVPAVLQSTAGRKPGFRCCATPLRSWASLERDLRGSSVLGAAAGEAGCLPRPPGSIGVLPRPCRSTLGAPAHPAAPRGSREHPGAAAPRCSAAPGRAQPVPAPLLGLSCLERGCRTRGRAGIPDISAAEPLLFCISVRGSALLWLGRGCLSPLRPHGWRAEGFYQSMCKLLVGCKAPGATSECCWRAGTGQIFSDIGVGMPGEAQGEGASGCCGARTRFGPQHAPCCSMSRPFEPCRASPGWQGWSAPFPAVISTPWMVPGLDTATQDKAGSVQEELCPFWVARERGEPWAGDPTPPDVRREERAAPGCPPGRKVTRRAAGA